LKPQNTEPPISCEFFFSSGHHFRHNKSDNILPLLNPSMTAVYVSVIKRTFTFVPCINDD